MKSAELEIVLPGKLALRQVALLKSGHELLAGSVRVVPSSVPFALFHKPNLA